MSMIFKSLAYRESLMNLLHEKQKEAERKCEYWSKRAKGKSPLVEEFEQACDYGFEAECYRDLITLVEEVRKGKIETRNVCDICNEEITEDCFGSSGRIVICDKCMNSLATMVMNQRKLERKEALLTLIEDKRILEGKNDE